MFVNVEACIENKNVQRLETRRDMRKNSPLTVRRTEHFS